MVDRYGISVSQMTTDTFHLFDKMANNTMAKRGQKGKQHNGKKRTQWQTTIHKTLQ
jgi:hypothetical protein